MSRVPIRLIFLTLGSSKIPPKALSAQRNEIACKLPEKPIAVLAEKIQLTCSLVFPTILALILMTSRSKNLGRELPTPNGSNCESSVIKSKFT